jgi:hypothetical protein
MSKGNGSQRFDGCELFIVVDREMFKGLLTAEYGSAPFLNIKQAVVEVWTLSKSETIVAFQRVLSPRRTG